MPQRRVCVGILIAVAAETGVVVVVDHFKVWWPSVILVEKNDKLWPHTGDLQDIQVGATV